MRRRSPGADRRARRARGAWSSHRRARFRVGQRPPDHAVACGARRRPGAPTRQAADRHDTTRHRADVRRQGDAHRHPGAGPPRPEDPPREGRARRRREEHVAGARLRDRAVRRGRGRRAHARARGAARALRRRHLAPRRPGAARRSQGAVRGRAGDASRPRPRHLSLCHVLEPDRGGGGGELRDRPAADRRGALESRRRT